MLTDTSYNLGKRLVQVILPMFASLYFVFELPSAEQVVGVTVVIITFLGVYLSISSERYKESGAAYDGTLVINTNEDGRKLFSLELDKDPDEIEQKGSISFKLSSSQSTLEV